MIPYFKVYIESEPQLKSKFAKCFWLHQWKINRFIASLGYVRKGEDLK